MHRACCYGCCSFQHSHAHCNVATLSTLPLLTAVHCLYLASPPSISRSTWWQVQFPTQSCTLRCCHPVHLTPVYCCFHCLYLASPPSISNSHAHCNILPFSASISAHHFQPCMPLLSLQHMVAGAAAGTVEHTAMFPVDTIKTRMQALSHPGQRVGRCNGTRQKVWLRQRGRGSSGGSGNAIFYEEWAGAMGQGRRSRWGL